jgi:hypothetical protein
VKSRQLDILRQYISLAEDRVPMVACCPFHDDNTPSYSNKRIDVENLPADNQGANSCDHVTGNIACPTKKAPPLRRPVLGALM